MKNPEVDSRAPATWDLDIDLLVVGAGAGGMTAALVALIEGRTALICEKSNKIGGTSARSSGGIWIPGNHQTERLGKPDSIDDARRYLAQGLEALGGDAHREAYLATGPEALDYLDRHSDFKFVPVDPHPDYHDYDGAAVGGRSLAPIVFDGRKLGRDFECLAAPLPELMVLGGMMIGRADIPHLLHPFRSVQSFKHAMKLVGRFLIDRLSYSRGTRLIMGNALAARLFHSLRQRHAQIWRNATVVELIRDAGRVVGAVVDTGGARRRVRARLGVILSTGGFGHSPAWRDRLMPSAAARARSLVFEANQGDGLALAQKVGAAVEDGTLITPAVWFPVSLVRRRDGSEGRVPHIFLDRAKPGLVAVNRSGKRFVNEADSYHDFVVGMLRADETSPSVPAYLICDRDFIRKYGIGAVLPGARNLAKYVKSGYLTMGNTLAELAGKLDIERQELERTIDRHNRFAETGVDTEFGKGKSFFNRFYGDPSHGPNPCLGKISQAPFAAVTVWPADISTFVGLRASVDAETLDANGAPIPGLYVCGNDMTSIWRGDSPGPGITLGPAIVFAYRAVMHAIGKARANHL